VASLAGKDISEKAVGWVRLIYIILIASVIGGMMIFNGADWLRKTVDRKH
jgi:hypothetical protein